MNAHVPEQKKPEPIKEPKKPRTTAQLWSRREKINETIAELQAEHAEITATLKGSLG